MSQSEGRPLDWNEPIEKDGGESVLLPDGEYPFTVVDFERGRHDGSGKKLPPCNMAKLTLRLDGGSLGTSTTFDRLYLHSSMEGKLCSFFRSIGQRQHGERFVMDWAKVANASGRAKVGIHTYKDRTYNEVKYYLDPADKPTAPPQTPPAKPAGFTPGKF